MNFGIKNFTRFTNHSCAGLSSGNTCTKTTVTLRLSGIPMTWICAEGWLLYQ